MMQMMQYLTNQMMQMMQIAFLASPPPQKAQKLNLKNLPSNFGPNPQTPYFLTSFAKHNSAGAFYEGWLS